MTINFEYEAVEKLNLPYEEIIETVIKKVVMYENCPYEIEINVILTGENEIKKINNEFRELDQATDVLSFPLIDYEIPGNFKEVTEHAEEYFNLDTDELMLGDIVLSVDRIKEQAKEYGHSKTRELAFLTAHSMLHLFGYDHMSEEERLVMEKKQDEILDELEITR